MANNKSNKIKLNVDLKKYLDRDLAKDNLKLVRALEEANNKIGRLEDELEEKQLQQASQKDKQLKPILTKLKELYFDLDTTDFKSLEKSLKDLFGITDLKFIKVIDALYELTDKDDGEIGNLIKILPKLRDLLCLLENYMDTLDE